MLPPVDRLLFPTDFSACAEGAYRHAAFLADRLGAELHVLHVVQDDAAPERAWPDAPGSGTVVVTAGDVYADLGLPEPPEPAAQISDLVEVVETEVTAPDVAGAILDYACDEEIGLVVLGTHGRSGWQRAMMGSVAEAVLRRAPCPVLTVRPLDASGQTPWPPRHIVLAVDAEALDDGEPVPASARWAARLAGAYGARLEIAHGAGLGVVALAGEAAAAQDRARLRELLLALGETLRTETRAPLRVGVTVRTGDPASVVMAVADAIGAHLIAAGTHARRGVGRVVAGSVAEDIVRRARCPVLVVRDALTPAGAHAAEAAGEAGR